MDLITDFLIRASYKRLYIDQPFERPYQTSLEQVKLFLDTPSSSHMASSNSSIHMLRWQEEESEVLGVLEDHDGTTLMCPFGKGNTPKRKRLRMHNHVEPINLPISSTYPITKDDRAEGLGDGWGTSNDQILQATKESKS